MRNKNSGKVAIRFAVVGLGNFAQTAILPAFAHAKKNAVLSALVTGDPQKARQLGRKYRVPAHSYEDYEALLESGEIDAVYIATPNAKHREFAEPAARAGVHVLCEKPLAYSIADAEAMIEACRQGNALLMTAYRLHFEAGNLQAIEMIKKEKIGEARVFLSSHTMQVDADNIRVDLSLGGGPLEDIGIYCLNAARYIFQDEPEEVSAIAVHGSDPRFAEVPETVTATLRFPRDRLASFVCGFGETKVSEYRVIGTQGVLRMDPAFTWNGPTKRTLVRKEREKRKTFRHRDQVAAELLYFADCITHGKEPEPSGREGLIDVRIIDALRRSYTAGRRITLPPLPEEPRPRPSQSIKRQPAKKPEPVKAPPPSRE